MMTYKFIKRIKRDEYTKLNALFSLIKGCEAYKYMAYIDFKSADIYTATVSMRPVQSTDDISYIIAGVKRVNKDDLGIKDLPYHCNSNDIVNYISFVHMHDPYNRFDSEKQQLFEDLIHAILVDKNDTHTVICKDICQEFDDVSFSNLKNALRFEILDDTYLIRKPITQ